MDLITMDLGDFVPENYEIRFAISGHEYVFRYSEATMDEILRIMWQSGEAKDVDQIERERTTVTQFLTKTIVEGDAKTLGEDLQKLPYIALGSDRKFDIHKLHELIQRRIKKNETGESEVKTKATPSGSRGTSRS